MRAFAVLILLVSALPVIAVLPPPTFVPRLDPDGLPLPHGAARRLGSGLYRTGGYPTAVAFSPDCGVVYVGRYMPFPTPADAHGLEAWDAAAGKPVWKSVAGMTVSVITPAADDKSLWVAGHTNRRYGEFRTVLARIRAEDGAVLFRRTLGPGHPEGLQVTPSGRVAVLIDGELRIYDPSGEKPIWTWPNNDTRPNLTFTLARDGKRLMTAHSVFTGNRTHCQLTGYDLPGGREAWARTAPFDQIQLNAHPDGKRAWAQPYVRVSQQVIQVGGGAVQAYQRAPAELLTWDVATGAAGEPEPLNRYAGRISDPHFRPGGKSAVAGFDGRLAEFELPTWRLKRKLPELPGGGWLSPDGSTFAHVSGRLALFDVDTGKRTAGRDSFAYAVEKLRFDGGRVTLARQEKSTAYDLATGRETPAPSQSPVAPRVVSEGDRLVVRRGERERELVESEGYQQYMARLTPDRKFALCSDNNIESVRVWDASTGEKKHDLPLVQPTSGSSGSSNNVSCAPDSRHLAVIDLHLRLAADKTGWVVSVWDIVSGKLVRRLSGSGSTAGHLLHWSPDARRLYVAVAADEKKGSTTLGRLSVCDPFSETPPRILTFGGIPTAVAGTSDGKFVAVADGRTVEFWDRDGKALRHTLRTPPFGVRVMAFTPDGKRFVTDGPEGTFLWPLPDLARPPTAPMPRRVR